MRKRRAVKRDVLPDPIYKSKVVTKLINSIMLDGKKGIAQTILYEAFDIVKEKSFEVDMKNDVLTRKRSSLCQKESTCYHGEHAGY